MDTLDPSNNYIHRRYDRGRVYLTDERHAETSDDPEHEPALTHTHDHHERFNLNQYYNAVEDEQLYMDEYTSLIQRYNEFIVNSNTLFTRMEMTLRENITRAVSRQTYYYHQSEDLYRRELRRTLLYRSQASGGTPTARTRPMTATAPAPATATQSNEIPVQQIGNMLPRLLSRYIATENARQQRHNNNLFSMLYTFPVETVAGAAGAAGNSRADGTPTNDQINRATLNTVFSHILSPVNATCPISRDEFNDESEITMIRDCNHIFNRSSLREWFVRHSTCPMCRRDIREYRPPSLQEPPVPGSEPRANTNIPRNISIDSADGDHVTFSYDLPSNTNTTTNTNNQEMYRNLINTVANMLSNTQNTQNTHNNQNNMANRNEQNDDDDIMEVD